MTEQGLIELYTNSNLSSQKLFLITLAVILLSGIIIALEILILKNMFSERVSNSIILSTVCLMVIVTIFCQNYLNEALHSEDIKNFEKTFENYLEENKEKHEVVYIKVSTNEEINGYYYSVHSKPRTTYTVMYKDGDKLISDVFEVETHMSLSKDDTPYLEYSEIKKDINIVKYPKGKYNPILYLPKGYKFDTLK